MAKILIVEDHNDLREMIASALRYAGHTVVAVGDGLEGLKSAEEERPDLIILDVHLPRLSGQELCKRLKRKARFRETPIILMSANAELAQIQACLGSDATLYLPKPFTLQSLTAGVESLLP